MSAGFLVRLGGGEVENRSTVGVSLVTQEAHHFHCDDCYLDLNCA